MQLNSVRILDLTRLLPGGYTTQLLAELGADVIKIEDPNGGDYARSQAPKTEQGVSALFTAVNRGKRSIALDLKSEAGQKALYRLIESADVLFEGFRPGVTDRLSISYETVREYNPNLIYCSLSGYGQTGPYRDRPGHDLNYAGVAGLVDMTRHDTTQRPPVPGFLSVDLAAGLFAAFCIMSQLLMQTLTSANGGNYVDVSMTDVGYTFGQVATLDAMCGNNPRPGETALTGQYPCYEIYETADDQYVTLAAIEPKFWRAFCSVINREDLVSTHLSSDPVIREVLEAELRELFLTRTRAEWEETFKETDVPFGVVNTPAETLVDPHLSARDLTRTGPDGELIPHLAFPARIEGDCGPKTELIDCPSHGEHTDEILRELGYSRSEQDRIRSSS